MGAALAPLAIGAGSALMGGILGGTRPTNEFVSYPGSEGVRNQTLNPGSKMVECFERFKMGAIMGSSVGACIGALFGTMAILKYPKSLL